MPDATTISSGNAGLDLVLGGGLPANRLYLLEGPPGSGKTTLALQFLTEGVRHGERVLYVTLSETREELSVVAASHGWTLDGIDVFELESVEDVFGSGREQSVLHPWEVELGETIRLIQDEVERVGPRRVVFDSLSEMRLLAHDALRYRRQILALKQYFVGRACTVLLVDDCTGTGDERDGLLHSLCHGVVTLERLALEFGPARRRMQVQKLRGVDFAAGHHDLAIRTGGIEIFPRLAAGAATGADGGGVDQAGSSLASGVATLDTLLGGGPQRGTTTLLTGPSGAGKTTVALQYLDAAGRRGEAGTLFLFDERVETLLARADALGLALRDHVAAGLLSIQRHDPADISPGEFAARVRREVEGRGARLIVIDSLNGYLAAMPQEQQLLLQIHGLLSFLGQRGVATFLVNPQQGPIGGAPNELTIAHIVDLIVLLRFFEADGRIRKAISVIKNRAGPHEDTIREFRIDDRGLRVGEPLTGFRGVLTGTPTYVGADTPLMEDRSKRA